MTTQPQLAPPPGSEWLEVREWRKRTREALIAQRRALPLRDKKKVTAAVWAQLAALAPSLEGRRVGFYWPMKGELDLVGFVRARARVFESAALPVVIERNQPLEFWRWTTSTKLSNRGLWNIPTPVERAVVVPDVLLIPLVGFDAAGFRLGYGGGYYDRTIAQLGGGTSSQPGGAVLKIGVGHELGRLATIHPQWHDLPMDIVITERGTVHR